jgi:hypothetical protein
MKEDKRNACEWIPLSFGIQSCTKCTFSFVNFLDSSIQALSFQVSSYLYCEMRGWYI